MVVTCHTCHRGTLAAERFPPLPPRDYSTIVDKPVPTLPTSDEVWTAYRRAVAGPADGFATTILIATDDRNEDRHGSLEVVFKGSDRVRVTSTIPPDGTTSQAAKGDAGWIARGNQSRVLRADEVSGLRRMAERYRPIKLDRPGDLRISGVERVGSRDAYVAFSEPDSHTRRKWFFDVITGLLLRVQVTTETALVPLQQQVDYEDYRRVDGVMMPFIMRLSDGAPFSTSTYTFTSIRHNVEVDDSSFERSAQPPR